MFGQIWWFRLIGDDPRGFETNYSPTVLYRSLWDYWGYLRILWLSCSLVLVTAIFLKTWLWAILIYWKSSRDPTYLFLKKKYFFRLAATIVYDPTQRPLTGQKLYLVMGEKKVSDWNNHKTLKENLVFYRLEEPRTLVSINAILLPSSGGCLCVCVCTCYFIWFVLSSFSSFMCLLWPVRLTLMAMKQLGGKKENQINVEQRMLFMHDELMMLTRWKKLPNRWPRHAKSFNDCHGLLNNEQIDMNPPYVSWINVEAGFRWIRSMICHSLLRLFLISLFECYDQIYWNI